MRPVLQVRNLTVRFEGNGVPVPALRGISFDMQRGEVLGLVGESGSGKSTLAAALLQLLPPAGRIVGGSVLLHGHELTLLNEKQLERIRGAELSLIFQEPAIALSPVMRIGPQITNIIRAHRGWKRSHCRQLAQDLLAEVGLSEGRIYDSYPHELSSGQKQRVTITQAIACAPAIVIADEPTANLDVASQAGVVNLFKELRGRFGLGLLFITHNPTLLAGFADRVMVMYAGQIVEQGPTQTLLQRPMHPYSAALLRSIPCGHSMRSERGYLSPIPGDPPDMAHLPGGCTFAMRCQQRIAICPTCMPEITQAAPNQWVRCLNPGVV